MRLVNPSSVSNVDKLIEVEHLKGILSKDCSRDVVLILIFNFFIAFFKC